MVGINSIIFMILFFLAYQGAFHKNEKIRILSIGYILFVGLTSIFGLLTSLYVIILTQSFPQLIMVNMIFSIISIFVVDYCLKEIFRKQSIVEILKYIWFRIKRKIQQ